VTVRSSLGGSSGNMVHTAVGESRLERIIKQKQIEQPARFRFLSPENCNLYDSCLRRRLHTGQGGRVKPNHEPRLIQILEIFLFLLCKSLPSYSKSFLHLLHTRKTNDGTAVRLINPCQSHLAHLPSFFLRNLLHSSNNAKSWLYKFIRSSTAFLFSSPHHRSILPRRTANVSPLKWSPLRTICLHSAIRSMYQNILGQCPPRSHYKTWSFPSLPSNITYCNNSAY
jgi:hypothetical protein